MKPCILLFLICNSCFVSRAQFKKTSENPKQLSTTIKPIANLPAKNIGYDFSNVKACIEITPPNFSLPPRTASNTFTYYKINMDGTINNVAVQRQPLAATTDKMWGPGEIIKIGFDVSGINISTLQKAMLPEKVKSYARQWEYYSNIKMEFVPIVSSATIRVGFIEGGGSYSYIGRDALNIPSNTITMNFGWLATTNNEELIRRVIIHEFGHALGFIHEHQSPVAGIPWDKEKVYAFYALPPNNWSRADVDRNLFAKDNITTTNYSTYDPLSIMHYAVPAELTTNGIGVTFNTDFSATDKRYASLLYPFPPPPPNAYGTLKTGDDCDAVSFSVEYGVVDAGKVAFRLELGKTGTKMVTWWKQVGIPLINNKETFLQVQNHSLIASENKTVTEMQIAFNDINRNKGMSFWKGKILGVHTLLNYQWNVLPAIRGGCRITMIWNKDSCP